jgi:ferredoxin
MMAHVVTAPCLLCRNTECAAVCPVDCFKGGEMFLVIDPEECIDCGVCVPACPTGAIKAMADIGEEDRSFVGINAYLSKHPEWKTIAYKELPRLQRENCGVSPPQPER